MKAAKDSPFLAGALSAVVLLLSKHPASAQDLQLLRGHVPGIVNNLQATGRLPVTNRLHLAIGLPLRNPQALSDFNNRLYDPSSPDYHHYLTPQQFTEKFGPTESDYANLIAFVKANGFAVTETYPNRRLVNVEASVGDIEKAFHTTLRTYRHPTENRAFFAPDTEPSVATSVPILHVAGLDNFALPHPADLHAVPLDTNSVPLGTGSRYGSFIGNDFRAAFVPGVALDGAGQSVGIVAFDGYYSNDIALFELYANEPNVLVTNILLDGFDGSPGSANDETALDIQMPISMAPGLSSVVVYEGIYSDSVLNRMASDGLCRQLSSSWLYVLSPNITQDFEEFKAQGQVMFQASGDNGNYDNVVNTPLGSASLVTVGGTMLTTDYGGGPWSSETTWPRSGGGVCPGYAIPTWQQSLNMTTNLGSTTLRNLPDVAMPAINIYAVANNGIEYGLGGTSASSPLWAGFAALINQQAAINSEPPVGFLNPALYSIGQSSNYTACFHDITTGNNTNGGSGNTFFAVPGYDLCTGWGTPTGSNLINTLAPFYALRVAPATAPASAGQIGGPFAAQSFSLTNAATSPLDWNLGSDSIWLNVTPSSGTLAPGQTANLIATPGPAANFLPAGQYTANLSFNSPANPAQSRQFILTVNPWLQNGGFETGDFSSWTFAGTNAPSAVVSSTGFAGAVHSGVYGAQLANSSSPGFLSQTIPTAAGGLYLLSCWLDSTANPNSPHKTTPNQFVVTWNGTNLFNQSNIGVIGWTNLQFIVAATGTNSVLQFGFRDDPWVLGLDDITLQRILPPASQSVAKANRALNSSWDVAAGVRYQLQYKTNLAQVNWLNLGNPITATNLIFTTTDTNASDSQKFYRLTLAP